MTLYTLVLTIEQKRIACIIVEFFDLVYRGPSGVRAQAMDLTGELVDDFVFDSVPASADSKLGPCILHCRNAPSPGATSSLAIAKMIVDKMQTEFKL